jgi:ubiquinone/menaquinone biosynthesis C-methylase UbiE
MTDIKTAEAYNKFAKYYDAYINDFKDDLALYCSFCSENDRILEVGCGTGRVIKHLLEKGLTNVTGVDISEEMLIVARKNLLKHLSTNTLTLERHDFCLDSLKKSFNKVFITYYTFNYVLDKPDKFLRNLYLSMANNSLIIIDLFYPLLFLDPESDNRWIERELRFGANKTITLRSKNSFDGIFEERTLVFVEDRVTTTVETSRRFYSREEIEKLLHDAGFRNIKVIYGYSFGDSSKLTDDYPLHGFTEFNVNLDEYENREELKCNFVVYAHKLQ